MKSMTVTCGLFHPIKITATSRQGFTSFSSDNYCSDDEAKSAFGNVWAGTYDYRWDASKRSKAKCVERIARDIESTEKKLAELKFALKVIKNNKWVKEEL